MTMLMCLLFLSSSSDSASHSVVLLGLLVMDIFIEPIGMTIKDLKTKKKVFLKFQKALMKINL